MKPKRHAWWAVKCKKCQNPILLSYVGIFDKNRVPVLVEHPEKIPAKCLKCEEKNEYTRADVGLVTTENGPPYDYKPLQKG
jgi:hypothetical protein